MTKPPHLSGLGLLDSRTADPETEGAGFTHRRSETTQPRDAQLQSPQALEGLPPALQVCPSRRQHLRADKGDSSDYDPKFWHLLPSVVPLCPQLPQISILHLQQETPCQTWCTPPQTCCPSSLPYLCALAHHSPSCSDKISKNCSWLLSFSHTSHIQHFSKCYWLHLQNITQSCPLLTVTTLARSPNPQQLSLGLSK